MACNGISKQGAKIVNAYRSQSTKSSKRKTFVAVTQVQAGTPF